MFRGSIRNRGVQEQERQLTGDTLETDKSFVMGSTGSYCLLAGRYPTETKTHESAGRVIILILHQIMGKNADSGRPSAWEHTWLAPEA